MAVQRVEQLFRKVTRALSRAKIPYAVVGGHAVAAWVATVDPDAVRFTKDVDILARRSSLLEMESALRPIGLMQVEVLGVMMFVDRRRPSPRGGVHVVIARERIRAGYAHPAPDVTAAVTFKTGVSIINLAALVAMKLQAFRDIDRAHIRDLHSVGLIDASIRRKLPKDLKARLKVIERSIE